MKFIDKAIQDHLLNGGKIKRAKHVYPMFLSEHLAKLSYRYIDKIVEYSLTEDDLTSNDWEIVEPQYNWNKVIADKVLCVFSDNKYYKNVIISTLTQQDRNIRYYTAGGCWFRYCKLFNPEEYNIAIDFEEYRK